MSTPIPHQPETNAKPGGAATSPDHLGVLRRGWLVAAEEVAPNVTDLPDLLTQRFGESVARFEESQLATIIDDAATCVSAAGDAGAVPALVRRMRQVMYEYLLALDTLTETVDEIPPPKDVEDEESAPPPTPPRPPRKTTHHRRPHATAPSSQFVAPKAGFHLGHPLDMVDQAPAADDDTPATPALPAFDDGTAAADTAAPEAMTSETAEEAQIRSQVERYFLKRKYDRLAEFLQELAHDGGGRFVGELAVDFGDRCRLEGKRSAAAACYLAARRADPTYESPLGRLADLAVTEKDRDRAVGYFEQLVHLTQMRGDVAETNRIRRSIIALAPDREDILNDLVESERAGESQPSVTD